MHSQVLALNLRKLVIPADCYPFRISADPIQGWLTKTQVNTNLLNPCLLLLKVWLVPFVYEVSKSCSGIFDIWSKLASELYKKVEKIRPRVHQGMPKPVQGGTPQRFRITGRKQKALPDESFKQLAPKWDPRSESFGVFWVIFFKIFRFFFGMYV